MQNPIPKGTRVFVTTTNGGRGFATLVEAYRPTYYVELQRDNGSTFSIEPARLASIEPRPIDGGDADVMLTAELLQTCGMSPLDRELWAADHGRHYAGGSKRRLLADMQNRHARARVAS